MKTILLLTAAWLALGFNGAAKDFSNLYDDAILQHWQGIFEEDLNAAFKEEILPRLTVDEKQRLGKLRIEVPLRGLGNDVFSFYSPANKSVAMPALSIRFFADLLTAQCWLVAHGYNPATVDQYLGMLYYREAGDFQEARFPRPLEALQIPATARQEADVAKAFAQAYNTAIRFILCHELGHVRHQHAFYGTVSPEQSRADEAQADRFAVDLLQRMGQLPAGAPFWFSCHATINRNRIDFSTDAEWKKHLSTTTHPLDASRIESLANAILEIAPDYARAVPDSARARADAQYLANQVRGVALILQNEGLHKLFRLQAASTEPKMLAPRRTAAYEVQAGKEPFADLPFSGVYECEFKGKGASESTKLRLILRRDGDKVTGEYSYATAAGKVSGTVQGSVLNLTWRENQLGGKARFESAAGGGNFTGVWGERGSEDNGGTWTGQRKDPR